jgi:hypothetical protein
MNRYREERPERIFYWIFVCLLIWLTIGLISGASILADRMYGG